MSDKPISLSDLDPLVSNWETIERIFAGLPGNKSCSPLHAYECFVRRVLDIMEDILGQPQTASLPGHMRTKYCAFINKYRTLFAK